MLGTRSLIGLILSLLVHAGAVAFFVTQNDKKEKPKPKKITLQMAMFQTAPAKNTPPKSASAVIKKPIDVKPEVVVTPPPQAAPVVASKPKPIATVKPIIKKKPKPKKKRIVKKKKRIKKVLKKTVRKVVEKPPAKPRKARAKKKVVIRQPHPIIRRAPPPVYRKPPVRRVAPAQQRIVRPVAIAKPTKHQQGNPLLEKQYGKGIYGMINQKKSYPRRAKRRKIQGIVKVAFTIAKNGLISNLRIHQSSGSSLLDKAALDAVRKVGRFPSIPNAVNKQMLSYIIPLSYRLR